MNWLERFSRNLGLMVHEIAKPVRRPPAQVTQVRHEVEEQRLDSTTVLRRTTIEEVEIRPPGSPGSPRPPRNAPLESPDTSGAGQSSDGAGR